MGRNSEIEWTHHTFNPWWGCQRVSAGCRNCYAEAFDRRFGPSHWGPSAERKVMGEAYWYQPLRWNRAAELAGQRSRVFCASMADVFERRSDLEFRRERLWRLISETPALDWLLLTKRPENIEDMLPVLWLESPQPNVWLGTSVEDQRTADERMPSLLGVMRPPVVRFLSMEPLLGPVTLPSSASQIDLVIVGGESGRLARPMHPDWVRSIRDQTQKLGCRFFFKQWGEFDGAGSKVGKKAAGRILDGRTWDEMPEAIDAD